MKMDFINMSPVLAEADRKLRIYIWKAAYYMNEADIYEECSFILLNHYPEEYASRKHDMAELNLALARCELNAARSLISWLQEMDLIDIEDWSVMNHTLMGTSIPEDRS